MVRKYQRKPAARKYADYTADALKECLDEVRSGRMSRSAAAAKYNVSVKTIYNKLKPDALVVTIPSNPVGDGADNDGTMEGEQLSPRLPGGQTVFSVVEEDRILNNVMACAEFGFPLDRLDIRVTVRNYLMKIGRTVSIFKDNLPGEDWCASFIKRHPRLSVRFATNISVARAKVTEETITSYIENLKATLEGVAPDRIYNYDETNLSDDPGAKQIVCRRGCKYPEIVLTTSKSCTSLMMCGNAVGEILPPYVVYKGSQMWGTWREGGPKGTKYNSSPSGWFDTNIFHDWFVQVLIPAVRHKPGVKVVIGDNLSSHFSPEVIQLCREHDIIMVCLPPNSTQLTQPLDVCFFRPMKIIWRRLLFAWKTGVHGRRNKTLQKSDFPRLLKKLYEELVIQGGENLRSGFRTCGIYPTDAEPLLNRLPNRKVSVLAIDAAFVQQLEETRAAVTNPAPQKQRKKAKRVVPGKAIGNAESEEEEEEVTVKPPPKKRGRKRKIPIVAADVEVRIE